MLCRLLGVMAVGLVVALGLPAFAQGAGGTGGAGGGVAIPCATSAECPTGQLCSAQVDPNWPGGTGWCYEPQCASDAGCEAPLVCDPAQKLCLHRGCTTDGDCPTGQACGAPGGGAGGTGGTGGTGGAGGSGGHERVCVIPGCFSDADCTAAEQCDPTWLSCVPRSCAEQADCPAPAHCVLFGTGGTGGTGGTAGAGGRAGGSGGTGGPGGTGQQFGYCQMPECTTDAECSDRGEGRWTCMQGTCGLPLCSSDAQCTASERCAAGRCFPVSPCDGQVDCPSGTVCVEPEGYCLDTCAAQGGCGGSVGGGGTGGSGGTAGGGGASGSPPTGDGADVGDDESDGAGCSSAGQQLSLLALATVLLRTRRR